MANMDCLKSLKGAGLELSQKSEDGDAETEIPVKGQRNLFRYTVSLCSLSPNTVSETLPYAGVRLQDILSVQMFTVLD